MRLSKKNKAVQKINEKGVLLVFPIKNDREPASLWYELFPKKEMLWEWSDDGQDEVPFMWGLMKELSSSGDVVYSKWYKDRATFFSKDLFRDLLTLSHHKMNQRLAPSARLVLDELQSNSPMSTKEIKLATGLQGKFMSAEYARSLRALFQKFFIVGFGEVADGAFPSLAVGASQLIFEDLWLESKNQDLEKAIQRINKYMPTDSHFRKFLDRTLKK